MEDSSRENRGHNGWPEPVPDIMYQAGGSKGAEYGPPPMLEELLAAIGASFLDDAAGSRIVTEGIYVLAAEKADEKNEQCKHRFVSFLPSAAF